MRECDGCTACCTVLDVPGLCGRGERCEHQGDDGCGIYSQRPDVCRQWQCQWLADNDYTPQLLKDAEKPNTVGLMVNIDSDEKYGTILVVHEIWPGAVEAGMLMIERLAEHATVLVRRA